MFWYFYQNICLLVPYSILKKALVMIFEGDMCIVSSSHKDWHHLHLQQQSVKVINRNSS